MSWAYQPLLPSTQLLAQTSPTTVLNSPADTANTGDLTPNLNFTGTDAQSDEVEYHIQVHTDNTFKPTTPVNLIQEINNTDQSSVTTSSFTRVEGRLYLLSVESKTEITVDPNEPTASGTGLSFTVPSGGTVLPDNSSSSRRRLTFLYAIASSSGTGTITVDFGGQTQVTTGVIIDEMETGFNSSPVVQATNANSQVAVTSLSATLAAFGNTDNVTYGIFGASNGTTNPTPGSGFTTIGQARDGTEGNLGLETMYQSANATTVDWTFASDSEVGCIAVEIKAGTLIDALSTTDAGFSGAASGNNVTTSSLTSGFSDTDATSYTTASISPTANNLVIVNVTNVKSSTPDTPTISGNGLTWVQIDTHVIDSVGTMRRQTMFRSMGASPSSGAVTIDFGGNTQTACSWVIDQFSGVDTSGTNGSGAIVQSAKTTQDNTGNTTSITATLSAFSSANNATYGAFSGPNRTGFSAGSGFTLLGSGISTTPASNTDTEWKSTNDTTVDFNFDANDGIGVIGLEIKAGHPYPSASATDYTTQSDLTASTVYYWRVRAIDPAGSNTWGAWATTRSFTATAGGGTVVQDLIGGGFIPFAR